jgi:hypothetical protein
MNFTYGHMWPLIYGQHVSKLNPVIQKHDYNQLSLAYEYKIDLIID